MNSITDGKEAEDPEDPEERAVPEEEDTEVTEPWGLTSTDSEAISG
jgi:hypothetical protein